MSSVKYPRRIYLDHHSTTPLDSRVLAAMLPWLTERFGNAASAAHGYGWEAAAAVEMARERVAEWAGASAEEVVFTSGATEAMNLALRGVSGEGPVEFFVSAVEHAAVLETVEAVVRGSGGRGRVTTLGVDNEGVIQPESLRRALAAAGEKVSGGKVKRVVAVQAVNNEVGTVQPLEALAAVCAEYEAVLVCDAAQAVGRVSGDVVRGAALVGVTAHKFYGPKGVGALIVRRRNPAGGQRVVIEAQQTGGGHEGGRRSGTLNVAGIVGMGEAVRLAMEEGAAEAVRVARLRDALFTKICAVAPGSELNGTGLASGRRVAGNLNAMFRRADGRPHHEGLLAEIVREGVACSSGSACASAKPEPSHVLLALGRSEAEARASIRFGLGRHTTDEEIELAGAAIERAVSR